MKIEARADNQSFKKAGAAETNYTKRESGQSNRQEPVEHYTKCSHFNLAMKAETTIKHYQGYEEIRQSQNATCPTPGNKTPQYNNLQPRVS